MSLLIQASVQSPSSLDLAMLIQVATRLPDTSRLRWCFCKVSHSCGAECSGMRCSYGCTGSWSFTRVYELPHSFSLLPQIMKQGKRNFLQMSPKRCFVSRKGPNPLLDGLQSCHTQVRSEEASKHLFAFARFVFGQLH